MNDRRNFRKLAAGSLSLILLATLLLTACPPSPSVAEIQRNPGKYGGREIVVHGAVDETYGLLGAGAYRINDGTGTIWVMSQGFGVPGRGANVHVAGTLIQGATFGGRSLGMAIRQTRATK
jgi:hypothetical protein